MAARSNGYRRAQDRERLKRRALPCHICGQPIDYTLKTPDPMSFELDHVVPVRTSPEREHDPTNHAASHRTCNRAKWDGPVNGTKKVPTSRSWL